jgi:hypothetical protein
MKVFISPFQWGRPSSSSLPVSFDIAKPQWMCIRFKLYDKDMELVQLAVKCYDWRSAVWPPCGPYWATAEGDDSNGSFVILVAFTSSMDEFMKCWPHAVEIDEQSSNLPIEWTERFYKPDWVV